MPGPILSMTKVDDVTFRMTLPIARPLNEELGWIWMVSPTAVEKHGNAGFGTNPVGTGGMKFSKLVGGQQFEMVRNPDYWGKPFNVEKIIVRPIADATARADALITGSINMAVELDPVTLSPLKRAGDKIYISPRIHTWDVIFNTQTSPFKNKVVRQALNYAIDRNAIANDILKGQRRLWTSSSVPAQSGTTLRSRLTRTTPTRHRRCLPQPATPTGSRATGSPRSTGQGCSRRYRSWRSCRRTSARSALLSI